VSSGRAGARSIVMSEDAGKQTALDIFFAAVAAGPERSRGTFVSFYVFVT
jgi:hypothetical protein